MLDCGYFWYQLWVGVGVLDIYWFVYYGQQIEIVQIGNGCVFVQCGDMYVVIVFGLEIVEDVGMFDGKVLKDEDFYVYVLMVVVLLQISIVWCVRLICCGGFYVFVMFVVFCCGSGIRLG